MRNLTSFFLLVLLSSLPVFAKQLPEDFLGSSVDFVTYDEYGVDNDSTERSSVETLVSSQQPTWMTAPRMESVADLARQPVLVVGPKDTYTVRRSKAKLRCKALYATDVRFKCNGDWVKESLTEKSQGVDDVTQAQFLQAVIEISREQLARHYSLAPFTCLCYAHASGGTMRSDEARVMIASLRRDFATVPYSDVIPVGQQVNLPCKPPTGVPTPTVFWMKDGREIDWKSDSNIVLDNYGHLLINAARFSDSGNYTCGARNVAATRYTETVKLRIHQDGAWAAWSPWQSEFCAGVTCDDLRPDAPLPLETRSRTCSAPAPKNGGKECQGQAEESRPCDLKCPVNGVWSDWSPWTPCNVDCRQSQQRHCNAPAPMHGGKACLGPDTATRNCTAGLCGRAGARSDVKYSRGGVQRVGHDVTSIESSMGLVIGLSIIGALALLFLIVLGLLAWKRRSDRKHLRNRHSNARIPPGYATQATLSRDLQHVICAHDAAAKAGLIDTSATNTPLHGTIRNACLRRVDLLSGSKAPLLDATSAGGTSSADTKRTGSSQSSEDANHYASLMYDSIDYNQASPMPHMQFPDPGQHSPSNYSLGVAQSTVDRSGGMVECAGQGVTAFFPSDCFEQTQEVFLSVSDDISARPSMPEDHIVVSPVVQVGPEGLTTMKPMVVSFDHCAEMLGNEWTFSVYGNDTFDCQPGASWHHLVTLGQETINSSLYVQLQPHRCHVMTDVPLGRLCLVGRPNNSVGVAKHMRLLGFVSRASCAVTLRVYCVDDTQAAVQAVILDEQNLGGYPAFEPMRISFLRGNDLSLSLEHVAPEWLVQQPTQQIPGSHVWLNSTSPLHCAFTFQQADFSLQSSPARLVCRLLVTQLHSTAGTVTNSHPLTINAPTTAFVPATLRRQKPNFSSSTNTLTVVTNNYGASHYSVLQESPSACYRIPLQLRRRLCKEMDQPQEQSNDWRKLARCLGVDRYMPYFATKPSPTQHILDFWEAMNVGDGDPSADLIRALAAMGRADLAGQFVASVQL